MKNASKFFRLKKIYLLAWISLNFIQPDDSLNFSQYKIFNYRMGKKDEVADPEKMILEYMKTQNRPYSANDVFLNLQKKIGKTQVIKLMEEMSKKEKLVEKIYGKV